MAANILMVCDSDEDQGIVTVLEGEGHTVTLLINAYDGDTDRVTALEGDLSAYEVVYWSANGSGVGGLHAAETVDAVEAYAVAGGRVFVTGYDSIDSPDDAELIRIIGGTNSRDIPGAPGVLIADRNPLTVGVVDIRGLTPSGGNGDTDGVLGLQFDTLAVLPSATASNGAQWTTRFFPSGGIIAYVSNGTNSGSHASWTNTTAGGAGAYNAAVRNFAYAGPREVLFVSDSGAGTGMVTALEADGHRVTSVLDDFTGGDTPTLQGDLSAYNVVVWSASGTGNGSIHNVATTDAVSAYVNGGGRVFVTGYDSVGSPTDSNLISLLGCTGARDVPSAVGPVASVVNSLSTGLFDLRGVTPTGLSSDRDALTGCGADTTVAASSSVATESQWVLRTIGAGEIAYLSNGLSGTGSHASWTNEANAANQALRNFVAFGRYFDPDGDGSYLDCGPLDDTIYPGATDLCDGADNDCNPATLDGSDEATLGDACDGPDSDLCTEGAIACDAGTLACTDLTGDDLDICDGADNDCNPATLDGSDETTLGDVCDGPDSDLCTEGGIACDAGTLACTDLTGDDLDLCDGVDNDCNPATLDGADEATLGDLCDGPDSDLCTEGAIACDAGTLACTDLTGDDLESCDGADNDCNPATLDGADEATLGDLCDGPDSDLCIEGALACDAGTLGCTDLTGDDLEICDGADNDCNPLTLDGSDEATLGDACDGPDSDLCMEGALACDAGTLGCTDLTGDDLEICDGSDNDCNPATLDGSDEATLGDACDGDDSDLCTDGAIICAEGLMCDDDAAGALELCDGADNDCNPATADGADEATLGDACDGDDSDLCEEGAIVCEASALACTDLSSDDIEVCDGGVDNDCDGDADDADTDIGGGDPGVTGAGIWYADFDEDGCGDAALSLYLCSDIAPDGYVANADDPSDVDGMCCGNGEVDPGEVCDGDLLAGLPSACADLHTDYARGDVTCATTCDDLDTGACVSHSCGDGITSIDEDCDDGNSDVGDGCDDACGIEDGWVCDGALDVTSACAETCGDGVLDDYESCDDANLENGDGCTATCGVEEGWTCEVVEGVTTCDTDCGDGLALGEERCDDGNEDAGDGCYECVPEAGWACSVLDEVSVCDETCGDGALDAGEMCDDANIDTDDGCSPICDIEEGWSCDELGCTPTCGDGLVRGTESCDDANGDDGDGCDTACEIEEHWLCDGEPSTCSLQAYCGDGALDDGEACDDGNGADDDGCSALCAVESGWLCDDAAPTSCLPDGDEDGVADDDDNCADDANADQADNDEDGEGDVCDDDDDNDGVADEDDACPLEAGDGDDGCEETTEDVGTDTGDDAGTDTDDVWSGDLGRADTGADIGVDVSDSVVTGGGGCNCTSGQRSNAPIGAFAIFGLLALRRRRR